MRVRGKIACWAAMVVCLCAAAPPSASATFPGRPGLIVFNLTFHKQGVGDRTGGLFAFRPGWPQPRQLTDNPWDYDPSFAPNGKRLVFRRVNAPQSGLFTLDLGSGELTRITPRDDDIDPAFGPRGTVAFSRFSYESESYDLFLRTRDGRLHRLTSTPARDAAPAFTPDGERIVFSREYGRAVALGTLGAGRPPDRLFSIRTDGTGLRSLRTGLSLSDLDVSPDGRNLAFGAGSRVSAVPLRGGKPRLISTNASYPAYSPDGRSIAYANRDGLWRRPSAGGPPRLLFPAEDDVSKPESVLLVHPAWQPLP